MQKVKADGSGNGPIRMLEMDLRRTFSKHAVQYGQFGIGPRLEHPAVAPAMQQQSASDAALLGLFGDVFRLSRAAIGAFTGGWLSGDYIAVVDHSAPKESATASFTSIQMMVRELERGNDEYITLARRFPQALKHDGIIVLRPQGLVTQFNNETWHEDGMPVSNSVAQLQAPEPTKIPQTLLNRTDFRLVMLNTVLHETVHAIQVERGLYAADSNDYETMTEGVAAFLSIGILRKLGFTSINWSTFGENPNEAFLMNHYDEVASNLETMRATGDILGIANAAAFAVRAYESYSLLVGNDGAEAKAMQMQYAQSKYTRGLAMCMAIYVANGEDFVKTAHQLIGLRTTEELTDQARQAIARICAPLK